MEAAQSREANGWRMISFVPGYYGFLGNMMFQYAATRALAIKHGAETVWPIGKSPSLADLFPIKAFKRPHPADKVSYTYQEPHFHHDPAFWSLPDGTQLSGYFQSEKYFAPYAKEIREEFSLKRYYYHVPNLNDAGVTVSIHVRRGDYLSFPEHHPPLTMDYYRAAMEHFPAARFLVCSDDPGWCLLNFRDAGYPVQIITGKSPVEDMALMASCDHHIIANSSFSWWATYLADWKNHPNKKVIAPLKWFGPAKGAWNTKDLIPEGWVRL
jgi:hypothetical protein